MATCYLVNHKASLVTFSYFMKYLNSVKIDMQLLQLIVDIQRGVQEKMKPRGIINLEYI